MFNIIRADKANGNIREQISFIFAEGFSKWLTYFSKEEEILARAFAHMFILNQFYIALDGSKVVGFAACTDCNTQSVKLDCKELRKHLGFFKGIIASIVLKKEFTTSFDEKQTNSGSIEFVGTSSEYRGKGIASMIIKYILENTPFNTYFIQEVADTNIPAMSLYKKLGFIEYRSKQVPNHESEKIGINRLVSFKYEKH